MTSATKMILSSQDQKQTGVTLVLVGVALKGSVSVACMCGLLCVAVREGFRVPTLITLHLSAGFSLFLFVLF